MTKRRNSRVKIARILAVVEDSDREAPRGHARSLLVNYSFRGRISRWTLRSRQAYTYVYDEYPRVCTCS